MIQYELNPYRRGHSVFGIIGTCLISKFSKVPRKNLWMGGSVLEKG